MSKQRFFGFSSFFVFLFLFSFSSSAESFVSIHGYPQTKSTVEDYQIQTQKTLILNQTINEIVYPVFGFPAMITSDDPEMSFIIRSKDMPEIEYIRITREIAGTKKEFADLTPSSIEKCGEEFYKIKSSVPVLLPSARYDLSVKVKSSQFPYVSNNSVFFPEFDTETRFYIWTDPQIEDLQSKNAGKLNYNSGEYPFKSDSILDFSRQEGIIKASISQMNMGNSQFVTVLGDIVFGINYQREYQDILSLLINFEIPVFPVPGNHDGYAKFVDQNDLSSELDWDGLQYWARFIGPLNYSFSFNKKVFLMLNTYDGTVFRRAAGEALGIGDNAAVPVSNWGGFMTGGSLFWTETMINDYDVFGLFSHMMPLGESATGKYNKMKKFPKDSVIGGLENQEWNIETAEYDSDLTDMIFNETQTFNTGITLASQMTKQTPPPIYFSGHTHMDRIYNYKPGDELVPASGLSAKDDMEFIMTTTAATSGESFWGLRKVEIDNLNEVSYNYTCERGVQCMPDSETQKGFQSIPAGNMWTTYKWLEGEDEKESIFIGGNGLVNSVSAEVVNYLPTEEKVTLRFILPAGKGYKLDNTKFSFSSAGISKDLSTIIITVKGKISAGTTMEKFLLKDFSRKVEFVKISPVSAEVIEPEIEYSEKIFDNEPITAKIKNSDKFLSLVWMRNKIEFAHGESFSVKFEDYQSVETILLTYITKDGSNGTASFKVNVEPFIEEPDQMEVDESDDSEIDDGFDAENNDDETIDEIPTKRVKKSGCSVIIL